MLSWWEAICLKTILFYFILLLKHHMTPCLLVGVFCLLVYFCEDLFLNDWSHFYHKISISIQGTFQERIEALLFSCIFPLCYFRCPFLAVSEQQIPGIGYNWIFNKTKGLDCYHHFLSKPSQSLDHSNLVLRDSTSE